MAHLTGGPVIRPDERALFLGKTRMGKSTTCKALYLPIRTRKICIDVKKQVWLPGAQYVTDPKKIDWRPDDASIVFRPPNPYDVAAYDAIYMQVMRLGQVTVWLDECVGPTTAHAAPKWLRLALTQGAAHGVRMLNCSQRPVNLAPDLVAQADHIIIMQSFYTENDLSTIAGHLGLKVQQLQDGLDRLEREFGAEKYAHLWADTTTAKGTIYLRPPMPTWAFQ